MAIAGHSANRAVLARLILVLCAALLHSQRLLEGLPALLGEEVGGLFEGQALPAAELHRALTDEQDVSGYILRTPRGWAFSYEPGDEDDEAVFHLETHPIVTGEYITLTDPDGQQLPFRIVRLRDLD